MNEKQLINFEQDIAQEFNNANIKAPVHLNSNNEEQLINIFDRLNITNKDWICCTWRSHYECLLKGVPEQELKDKILNRQSISLCFKDYNIISSAIVGGICPVALGLAMGIKQKYQNRRYVMAPHKKEKVYCFIGDMSAETGIFHECWKYSIGHGLPIVWVIADNNKAVCTDTKKSWGQTDHYYKLHGLAQKIVYYQYDNDFPHAGGGQRVNF